MRLPATIALTTLALTTLVASSSPVDAKCAMDNQAWSVVTVKVDVPADGGGIVVATLSVPYSTPATGDALQKSFGFLTGRDLMQPVITVLAPGLVVYGVRPGTRTTGELVDGTGGVIANLTVTKDKVARLPAPKLKEVVHFDDGPGGTKRTQATTARLDGPAPADAVALVVYNGKNTPKSWGPVETDITSIEIYSHRRCEVLPNGTLPSKAGDKVMLAWVDKYGRLSAKTKLVTIKVKK